MQLLFLDLETTGLNPRKDDILEVGAIFLDVNADQCQLRQWRAPFRCLNRDANLSKIKNAHVLEMHKSSHLYEEVCRGKASSTTSVAITLRAIEERLLQDMVFAGFPIGKTQVAGYSPHFDLGFITAQMPLLRSALHHRVFDVSTLQSIWLETDADSAQAAKDTAETKHRAVPDCEQAISTLLQWLQAWDNPEWSFTYHRELPI